jgi:hypothetical protein
LFTLFGVAHYQLLAKSPIVKPQTKIYSLASDWSIYDNQLQAYVPFLPSLHTEEKQLYLTINTQKYKDFYISLFGEKGVNLFINNNLVYHFQDSTWLHLRVDSLQKTMQGASLLLTYWSIRTIKTAPISEITWHKKEKIAQSVQIDTINNIPSNESKDTLVLIKTKESKIKEHKNFLLLATLGILAVMAIFSITSKPIFSFAFLSDTLSDFLKGKNQIKRLSTPYFIFFVLYYGLILAFVVMFFSTYSSKISYRIFFDEPTTLGKRIEIFLLLTFVMIAFITLKYTLIWILGSLYNDKQLINLHFQEYMNLSQFFCVTLLAVTLLANSIATTISQTTIDFLVYFFAFCMLSQSILMSYRINNAVIHKKLYLFSYLCASEYIPLFLSAKLLMS